MRHPRLPALLTAVLFGLLPFSASAQAAGTVKLYGTVTGDGSGLVVGTTVQVRTPGTTVKVAEGTVAADGKYEIVGLTPGTYDVRLTPPANSGCGSTLVARETLSSDRRLDLRTVGTSSAVWFESLRDGSSAAVRLGSVTMGRRGAMIGSNGRFSARALPGTYKSTSPARSSGTAHALGRLPPTGP